MLNTYLTNSQIVTNSQIEVTIGITLELQNTGLYWSRTLGLSRQLM